MAKRNYLIEGVSGTGKSSVCDELKRRGYNVVNGDEELAYNGDPETGEHISGHGHQTWIWDAHKVRKLVQNREIDMLFFCGGSRNFDKFLDCFDEVFILQADDATIKQRLLNRPGNVWGKKPSELELILKLNKSQEDIPSHGISINTMQSLSKVVDEILAHT